MSIRVNPCANKNIREIRVITSHWSVGLRRVSCSKTKSVLSMGDLSSHSQLVYINNKTFIFKTTVTTYTTQTTFMLVTHAACCTCCISCTCCFFYIISIFACIK